LAGDVARIRARRVAYRVLVGRPDWKSPLGRPRCRWKCNIEKDVKEVD